MVRNLSTYAKRIRCEVPRSAEFRVVTEMLGTGCNLFVLHIFCPSFMWALGAHARFFCRHICCRVRNEIGVAPGLSVSIDVEFLTRKPYDYVDKLVITAEAAQPGNVVKNICFSIVYWYTCAHDMRIYVYIYIYTDAYLKMFMFASRSKSHYSPVFACVTVI